ncbi:sigma D regulator [Marinimicrobium sp. C2-29]|uniref:sigma D regulator n=1 Tax=Marinimicrobium sp. C2-29 TaxID=3139825 RepID=UPI003139DC56
MLENCKDAKERWGGVSTLVDQWLEARRKMLVQFCDLSALKRPEADDQVRGGKLRRLCETLVDYVSAGHFEVYDQLIKEGREFGDKAALAEASRLFKIIDQTTQEVLDFNDKYLETDDLEALEPDLSRLGETLEIRFSAEDRMIEVLHTAHKDLVT